MDQDHSAAQRYLDELRRHLTRLPQAECDDAVKEIDSHIAHARGAGLPLAAVLARLGDAPSLARAYEADYLLAAATAGRTRRGDRERYRPRGAHCRAGPRRPVRQRPRS